MLKTAFATAIMAMLATAATAREYDIQLDGYCDKLKIHVSREASVGASVGKLHHAPCDNSLLTGTPAYASRDVTPNGHIVTASGDLGNEPAQFVFYINLTNGTYTLYSTIDGKAPSMLSGTWSSVAHDDDPEGMRGLPPIARAIASGAGARPSANR